MGELEDMRGREPAADEVHEDGPEDSGVFMLDVGESPEDYEGIAGIVMAAVFVGAIVFFVLIREGC